MTTLFDFGASGGHEPPTRLRCCDRRRLDFVKTSELPGERSSPLENSGYPNKPIALICCIICGYFMPCVYSQHHCAHHGFAQTFPKRFILSIHQRKSDHIRINLEEDVDFPNLTTGLEGYRLVHQALPEMHLSEVDTSVELFGKRLQAPILVSSMTGGATEAQHINRNLALAAEACGLAMGVGSQRAGLEKAHLAATFDVRSIAPNLLLFANLGAVQLNYGYTSKHCRQAVEMIDADALILHLNPLQEVLQPEGDFDWRDLASKIGEVCAAVDVPVIVKEVGWESVPRQRGC